MLLASSSRNSMRALRHALSHFRSILMTFSCIRSSAAMRAFLCFHDSPVGKHFPFLGSVYRITASNLFALGLPVFSSAMSCSISNILSRFDVVIALTSLAMIIGDSVSGSAGSPHTCSLILLFISSNSSSERSECGSMCARLFPSAHLMPPTFLPAGWSAGVAGLGCCFCFSGVAGPLDLIVGCPDSRPGSVMCFRSPFSCMVLRIQVAISACFLSAAAMICCWRSASAMVANRLRLSAFAAFCRLVLLRSSASMRTLSPMRRTCADCLCMCTRLHFFLAFMSCSSIFFASLTIIVPSLWTL